MGTRGTVLPTIASFRSSSVDSSAISSALKSVSFPRSRKPSEASASPNPADIHAESPKKASSRRMLPEAPSEIDLNGEAAAGEYRAGPLRPARDLTRSMSRSNAVTFVSLLKLHALDWLHFILLAGLAVGLHFLQPHVQFINADILKAHSWPLLPNTVPSWSVPVISLGIPLAVFCAVFAARRDKADLHSTILGLLFCVALTAVLTDGIKVFVGRPRPDFFWRCFPSGVAVFGSNGSVDCNGSPSEVSEGRQSFPSGHTSWAFGGLGFLALYLAGKLHSVSPASLDLWRFIPALAPLVGATFIGLSRIIDYWHFPTDVMAGALIGIGFSTLNYFRLYPPLTSESCHIPLVSLLASSQGPTRSAGPDVEAPLVDGEGMRSP